MILIMNPRNCFRWKLVRKALLGEDPSGLVNYSIQENNFLDARLTMRIECIMSQKDMRLVEMATPFTALCCDPEGPC